MTLTKSVQTLRTTIPRPRRSLYQRIRVLEKARDFARSQLRIHAFNLREAEKMVSGLDERRRREKRALRLAHQDEKTALGAKIADLEQKMKGLQTCYSSLVTSYHNCLEEKTNAERVMRAAEADTVYWMERAEDTAQKMHKMKIEMNELQRRLDLCEFHYNHVRTENDDLQGRLLALTTYSNNLKKDIATLKKKADPSGVKVSAKVLLKRIADCLECYPPTPPPEERDGTCSVCLEACGGLSYLFLPCRHVATCAKCSSTLVEDPKTGEKRWEAKFTHCPICRMQIVGGLEVFVHLGEYEPDLVRHESSSSYSYSSSADDIDTLSRDDIE